MGTVDKIYGKLEVISEILNSVGEDLEKCFRGYDSSELPSSLRDIKEAVRAYRIVIEKRVEKHHVK